MTKIEIPESELFKADVLGYLPEEYVEPAAKLIESQEPGEIGKKIDEILPKFSGISGEVLLRRLITTDNENVKLATLRSKEVAKWTKAHQEALNAAIMAPSQKQFKWTKAHQEALNAAIMAPSQKQFKNEALP